MSSSRSPETQPGVSPEALEAEQRSAQLAHEALHAVEHRNIPNANQLQATQDWLEGLNTFDADGNALTEQGQVIANPQELSEMKDYFANENWLLSPDEKDVLIQLLKKPEGDRRRKRDEEPEPQDKIVAEGLPKLLGQQIEQSLGPDESPAEKAKKIQRIAKLQSGANNLLKLNESVHTKATRAAAESHVNSLSPDAARVASDVYDTKLAQYKADLRTESFDTLDPVEQARLMQTATKTAEADALAAKENFIHRQPEAQPVSGLSERSAKAWESAHGDELAETNQKLSDLQESGLILLTEIPLRGLTQEEKFKKVSKLKHLLYTSPDDLSPPKQELIDIVGNIPGLQLPTYSELTAEQTRLTKVRGLKHRNKSGATEMAEHVTARNKAILEVIDRLTQHVNTLEATQATLNESREAAMYGTINDKLLASIAAERPAVATPESLTNLLQSNENAAQALELLLRDGKSVDDVLETELHISKPRREALVDELVAAGVLGPAKPNGERRVLIKPANIPALEQPAAETEPEPEPTETAAESTPTEATAEAVPTEPETTGLDKTAFAEIRTLMKQHISEAISSYLDDKRKQDPSATLTKAEEARLAAEVREEVLEESIVKRFGINDLDASYQQAIKEGARILGKELLAVVEKDAANLFRDVERIVRLRVNDDKSTEPAAKKWVAARKYIWEQTLAMLPVEDREPTARVFRELKKASDERRVAAREKRTAEPAPSNTVKPQPGSPRRNPEARETPRQRRERIAAERDATNAVNENARRTAIEA